MDSSGSVRLEGARHGTRVLPPRKVHGRAHRADRDTMFAFPRVDNAASNARSR